MLLILEHESCEVLNRDILEQLNLRNSHDVSSKEYDALSARIRNRLKQYTNQVEQLSKKLKLASVVSSITSEEHERRRRQVEVLQSNIMKLQDDFNKRKGINYSGAKMAEDRSRLLGLKNESSVFADMGTTSWGDVNTDSGQPVRLENTEFKTVDELRQDQQKMLRDQDEGLESLSKIISRQKQIATTINVEVDQQNELLDDISQDVSRVEGRIQRETNMVRVIGKKDNTCGYWIVIILLLITILCVALV
ncbi:UNVERIFIED_CONTAM: hypothetical protein PYX00_008640 [Menopon gallinae]|uniref:t-SNARE coiled-coil homology domain-containing protein n=1 Tax=Menopon gallinae TaxID=328185 RepID=A0AAW2HP09_9NEOP